MRLTLGFYGTLLLICVLLIYVFDMDWRGWFEIQPIAFFIHLLIGAVLAYGVIKTEAYWGFNNSRLGADFIMLIKLIGRKSIPFLLFISICAGFFEELLFRAIFQTLAIEKIGAAWGIIVVAVIFGLMHAVSFSYFTFTTFIGLILGVLYYHYADLPSLMAVHASYDFVALYLGIYVYNLDSDDSSLAV